MSIAKEIDETRALLEKAEQGRNLVQKVKELKHALSRLEECEDGATTESDQALIRNLRRAYARRLLAQLDGMNFNDGESWMFFASVFRYGLGVEVAEAVAADPALKASHDRFLNLWGKDSAGTSTFDMHDKRLWEINDAPKDS